MNELGPPESLRKELMELRAKWVAALPRCQTELDAVKLALLHVGDRSDRDFSGVAHIDAARKSLVEMRQIEQTIMKVLDRAREILLKP